MKSLKLCADNSRIYLATNWKPSIPLDLTLKDMFEAARLKC